MAKKLYNELGVDEKASADEIKQAFREKAKENHSDKGGDNDKMVALNHAYSILGNQSKRKRYDETGEEKEIGFDVKFAGLVQDIFMKIIDSESNIEETDLINGFAGTIDMIIVENKKHKAIMGRKIEKLEKVLKRISSKGENKISAILQNNIVNFKLEKKLIEENIEFFEKALEVVEHHEYKFDEPTPIEWSPMPQGFKWNSPT